MDVRHEWNLHRIPPTGHGAIPRTQRAYARYPLAARHFIRVRMVAMWVECVVRGSR